MRLYADLYTVVHGERVLIFIPQRSYFLFVCLRIQLEETGRVKGKVVVQMIGKADAGETGGSCRAYHIFRIGLAVTGKEAVHVCIPKHRFDSFVCFFLFSPL